MYHRDMMNAAVHCATPRFSPLTNQLCLEVEDMLMQRGESWQDGESIEGFLRVRALL